MQGKSVEGSPIDPGHREVLALEERRQQSELINLINLPGIHGRLCSMAFSRGFKNYRTG